MMMRHRPNSVTLTHGPTGLSARITHFGRQSQPGWKGVCQSLALKLLTARVCRWLTGGQPARQTTRTYVLCPYQKISNHNGSHTARTSELLAGDSETVGQELSNLMLAGRL